MQIIEKCNYWDFDGMCMGHVFQVGSGKKSYQFIDFAKKWNGGSYTKLMLTIDEKGKYKVFEFKELEGKKLYLYTVVC